MIKYKSNYDEEGIRFIGNRFPCCLSKEDKSFKRKDNYRKNLEIGLMISLVSSIIIFQGWKSIEHNKPVTKDLQLVINVADIPQTIQQQRIPAPSRPSVPIASEDEMVPEDETIELTGLNFEEIPLPPPPLVEADDTIMPFVPYDEPPVPIGGYAALQRNLVYPNVARMAGIQGVVILGVQIDTEGNVKGVRILKSLLKACDEAAIDAVQSVEWKPALQRDTPTTVWLSVRLKFELAEKITS